jgi:hypothetical protein
MAQHDVTVLSKNRARKTLGKCVGNHEVGPKRNEAHNTSSTKLASVCFLILFPISVRFGS